MATKTDKAQDQTEGGEKETVQEKTQLYVHTKRPQWGVAVLAWEKEDSRAYQFQDGRLRKFKKGYYDLLVPAEEVDEVERPKDAVVSDLKHAIEAKKGKSPSDALEPVAPFKAQVALFAERFPDGFQDAEWVAEHRGDTPGRALKRHRDPSAQETQKSLSKERCDELLAKGRHDELVDTVTEILGNTSLVALKRVKILRKLEGEQREEFAESVADLLHGEREFDERFGDWLELLEEIFGKTPSWRIATVLPALMYPQEHVCVRRSAFARQAASIAPLARYSRRASVSSYKNFRRVAFAVRKRLSSEGYEPRDLLDIHDFVWATLRNASLDDLGNDED